MTLLFTAALGIQSLAQNTDPTAFNETTEHGVSLGFSISSFNQNITYQISPAYHYRSGKHKFMFNPFVGRLDEVNGQFDFGFGLNYRLHPFKNRHDTRAFFQVGVDYAFQDNPLRIAQAMIFRFGPGVEMSINDRWVGGINVDLGLLQPISASSKNPDSPDNTFDAHMRMKILPFIRFAYAISKGEKQ